MNVCLENTHFFQFLLDATRCGCNELTWYCFFVNENQVMLREQDNEMSRKLLGILKKLREQDPSYYQLCQLVRQGEQPREGFLLLANLVEDQIGGSNGYADWIMQIHRQVLQNP